MDDSQRLRSIHILLWTILILVVVRTSKDVDPVSRAVRTFIDVGLSSLCAWWTVAARDWAAARERKSVR